MPTALYSLLLSVSLCGLLSPMVLFFFIILSKTRGNFATIQSLVLYFECWVWGCNKRECVVWNSVGGLNSLCFARLCKKPEVNRKMRWVLVIILSATEATFTHLSLCNIDMRDWLKCRQFFLKGSKFSFSFVVLLVLDSQFLSNRRCC